MKLRLLNLKRLFTSIDMTKGNIYKIFLLFTIPIVISSIFQQFYSITDAAIVGNFLSESEVNGIHDVGNINFMILNFAFGCTAGFNVITASKVGAHDEEGVRKSFLTQIILGLLISIFLTVVSLLSIDYLLAFIGLKAETGGATFIAAKDYLTVVFIGIIFKVAYNIINSVHRSLGNTITPLAFLIIATFLNIGLDFLFIAYCGMGVRGAALATIISECISATGCFTYTFIKHKELRFKKSDFKLSFSFVFEHLKNGIPLALQFSILAIGLILMQSCLISFDMDINGYVDPLGPAQLGYGVGCKISNFLANFYNAFGITILNFVAQNKGTHDRKRVKSGIKKGVIIVFIYTIITIIFLQLLKINGFYLHILLSNDKINERVIAYGNCYINIASIFYIFLGILYLFRNAIQGYQKPLFPFLAGVVELVMRVVACLFLPTLVNGGPINNTIDILENPWPFYALCFADPAAWMGAVITLLIGAYFVFYKKKRA